MHWMGPASAFLQDTTREIDLEAAAGAGRLEAAAGRAPARTASVGHSGSKYSCRNDMKAWITMR